MNPNASWLTHRSCSEAESDRNLTATNFLSSSSSEDAVVVVVLLLLLLDPPPPPIVLTP